jgi:5'-3' exonuclease
MGIPSYYKTLCDSIPGLLVKKIPESPTHFWVDFNCMIYHCIRQSSTKPYAGEETRIEWENEIIEVVCKYLKKLVDIVGPTKMVYIGVDGVVPMAKIRQQRLRRFKSVWIASEEERIGVRTVGEPRWDTNSITPGTAFMERLGIALHKIPNGTIKWHVSGADEPGEGEHKLMKLIR